MLIKFILHIILLSLIFPDMKPENNSTINYTHVLFEWDEISGASEYQLLVTSTDGIIVNTTTTNLFYVEQTNIDWNTTYLWQVCSSSNTSNCSDTHIFFTGSEIDLGELNLTIYNSDEYYDGVTIFGNLTPAFSAAIDKNGNQIWNSGGLNTFCYFNYVYNNGYKFYGGKYSNDPINILPGIEFDIDGTIIFEEPELVTPNYAFVQHEILKINDTDYLFFIPEDQQHPVPSCSTTPGCVWPGGAYDWEEDFFEGQPVTWRGEKIILWDDSTDEVKWEWDAFDYISLDDYDALVNWDAFPNYGYYDWTHFNAFTYDNESDMLYLSSRHLSRIYKIDLNSGNIEWTMGFDLTGNGNVNIALNDEDGNYNGFSFQHGLQLLENGNLITLDNGNISSLLFSDYDGVNKTRALEISINESNNTAEIVWEYILDESLYGALSGNVQKLNNGNYLITTIGDYGHTLEVNSNGEIVSDLQYKIDNYVTGKMYRADRITSIYPSGCTDSNACNYNSNARLDDGSCLMFDECGQCGGNGIGEGECDCNGNIDLGCGCGENSPLILCIDNDGDGDGAIGTEQEFCENPGLGWATSCTDDNDQCNGIVDLCGICNGNNLNQDCFGECFGSAEDLGCGCGEPEPTGCDNECESTAEDLGCGCGEPGPTGCNNECGSTAVIDCTGECGGSALDSDGDGICNSDDKCENNSENWFSNSITDYDSDGCQDETEDLDDDNDGLDDCWTYWYDDGILLSDSEKNALINSGECEDFILSSEKNVLPTEINLSNAYPNPFIPIVNFNIDISYPADINVDIYSVSGNLVESIYDGFIMPGEHYFQWNANQKPSGLYIINLTWDKNSIHKKVVLLK